ncbi:MAG: UDP-N-acetylmuramoyl-tripeptide--D-alanyl-D-alanine ligase [Gemmatimonadetes bacterium]|nr:UDP-N-acetylmuramoyl-tripeptide--D-alanyl-D-alanine ligase [Gemmatimonadota bacterium]NIQ55586.1 UDP-N-acetylmuramoyl-tripeptide--D-alanyl-D-alanine ligase [Gemmatimonadota bacterium]NIU75790.1 UDP-N-acetylmuramoyl-tripeptide--D-alanyl-D-alanine ligase [Gammaproteobacteria bacterium]NIX45435.1 UDP-N-acetylmuramoyl-tripeptide--D-alanyl-D-alanine ligase [Gemmatimonadota bacterium]NIY09724.1 UDP-N-acetylmuramoyl-tripeptide--D-alanyl-D-alanine ligase [Gemmatimonadota bacterium]
MSHWTEGEVLRALELAVSTDVGNGGRPDASSFASVGTDTRTLAEGALFVALRGDTFDGHDFLERAAESGARAAVVDRVPEDAPALRYYRVPNTLTALGRMGRARRRALDGRVVAITGTNGKTTTKEMARAVLATRYATHATSGNLNNLIGAPLTLLAAPDDAEALVVEIGTNAPGEIARLAEIVEPDVGLITAVAEGHLEGFGTVEGVLREKTSLLSRLRPGGLALVADEPRSLPERARSLTRRVRVAGWSDRADPELRAQDLRVDDRGRIRFRWQGRDVALPFGGRVHVRNALLALGLGLEWGVDPDEAVAALAALEPPSMRGELVRYGELRVLADCYNSNPDSLRAAVETLLGLPRGGGRVAVVGSMLELGAKSASLHRESAVSLAESDLDLIVATGLFVPAFADLADALGDRLVLEEDPEAAFEPMAERLRGDEVVLLKGSRGVALERLMPRLEARFGDPSTATGG